MDTSPRRIRAYLGMLIVLGLFYAALVADASISESVMVPIVWPTVTLVHQPLSH
jgi:hypothetical protein